MATASKMKFGPQDMPPPGGYPPIQTTRIPLRKIVSWRGGMIVWCITTAIGWSCYSMDYRAMKREKIEMRSARMALQPLLTAERERMYLKQLLKNRDEEEELMKDYPGWVVGTYFGEPIYKAVPADTYVEPTFQEYTVHAPPGGTATLRSMHRHYT